jgi:ribonuclease HII
MISNPDLSYEKRLWRAYEHVAGLDEAGRGALAGPVCVGAVLLPNDDPRLRRRLNGVRDSKQLTPRQRSQLAPRIKQISLGWGIGFADADEIDRDGIVQAARLAALRAFEALTPRPDFLLTDFRLELPELAISQAALVKGDQRSLSIACASILAKTARDEYMTALESKYPLYGFARHKGYGTRQHLKQIETLGYTPIHRRTFKLLSQVSPAG